MQNNVPVPPMELKQQDEGLLNVYCRKLQRIKQPEVMLVNNARNNARYADKRAQGMTPREARGEQHSLELDDGKFRIDLVCFCVIVQSCILIQVVSSLL